MLVIHVQNKEVNFGKQAILLLPDNEALFKHNRVHESTWMWIPLQEEGQTSFLSPPLPSLHRNEKSTRLLVYGHSDPKT